MSAQLPPAIESEAEAIAEDTELTVQEAVVVLCDQQGYANESIRAHLGATKETGELALDEIGKLLGLSNSSVEHIRADIRTKKRDLEAQRERIETTLELIEDY